MQILIIYLPFQRLPLVLGNRHLKQFRCVQFGRLTMEADAEDVRSRSRQARLILASPLVFPAVTSNFPALGRQIQMDMLDMIDRDVKTTGHAKVAFLYLRTSPHFGPRFSYNLTDY